MSKFSLRKLKKLENYFSYLIWFLLAIVFAMKFIFPQYDYIIRPLLYVYIYILIIWIIVSWVILIKTKGFWFEGRLAINNVVIYLGQIFLLIFPIWFWPPLTQSLSYLIKNDYQTIQGELIDKSTSTFTFSQWMNYKIKLPNGEIKNFDYLFPTKRAHRGDFVELKAGNRENRQIIITIDKIEKGEKEIDWPKL